MENGKINELKKIIVLRTSKDLKSARSGGAVYMSMLVEVLSKYFDISVEYIYMKEPEYLTRFNRFLYFLKMIRKARKEYSDADIFILNRKAMFFFKKYPGKKYIGMTHHTSLGEKQSLLRKLFYILTLYVGFRRVDILVAVSKYYQKYFTRFGAKDVRVINNAFEIPEVSENQLQLFKRKYDFTGEETVIYIGNNRIEKGVIEVYEQLKNERYLLVTSGKRETNIEVLNLDLSYEDYLILLAASDVVVTMSQLPEGWCRTAHEAMLMRTPVIGNGIAGMRELLEGGRQIICEDVKMLPSLIRQLLSDQKKRKEMGASGYMFAKQFTKERFQKEWVELLENM